MLSLDPQGISNWKSVCFRCSSIQHLNHPADEWIDEFSTIRHFMLQACLIGTQPWVWFWMAGCSNTLPQKR